MPSLQIAHEQEGCPILDLIGLGSSKIDAVISIKKILLKTSYCVTTQLMIIKGVFWIRLLERFYGYRSVALNQLNQASGLARLTGKNSAFTFHSLECIKEDSLIAPFIQLTESLMAKTLFSFEDANQGGFSHFKPIGVNSYGVDVSFKSQSADYDDLIIRITFPGL
ncbi:hypothetical protein PMIT1313_01615 [Prochlorococcus marinus str. MIT 1313]|uniref:hypothetical protein n=1 Tax=Prochlorococcus TaxID=1218 RepID=UPI0007BAE166|nr:hypothetical protein [Prochlorococcus marinus]KZR69155.1 hypothetical protein PMIT1313_01615 [Prochlorococcus marinus str. MIT 1313]KZR71827.1 hypothetical protein PMIT1318_01635 [Prochlorococcus marinus str. MIT 1318]